MKIEVLTQYYENYGAHDWDGRGICPDYWKAKGGYEYYITDVTPALAQSQEFWDDVQKHIEYRTHFAEEYIVQMDLVDDGFEDAHLAQWEPKEISAQDVVAAAKAAKS